MKHLFLFIAIIFLFSCQEENVKYEKIKKVLINKKESTESDKELVYVPLGNNHWQYVVKINTVYYFFYNDGSFGKVNISDYVSRNIGDTLTIVKQIQ